MSVIIPLRNDSPRRDLVVELAGGSYRIEYFWVARARCFSANIYDAATEELKAAGVRLVPNFPLAARIPIEGRPPGAFVLLDSTGKDELPGLLDLGQRHQLLFQEYDG